jgi:ubiquinone/menaquinone biosynthesis C-methylase UbiE
MSTDAVLPDSPPSDMTPLVRGLWDQAADGGHSYGNLDATDAQREAWTVLLSRLFPSARPLHILDVACGTGFVALVLAELGHSVTGLDVSPEVLRVCRGQAEERGITDLRLVEGKAEQPPADLGPFDAVVSRHLLWTLSRPEQAVAAWARLVRPGGRVTGIDALWSEELVRATAGEKYPSDVLRLLPLLHAGDLEPVHNVWRRAGLDDVMVEELGWIDAVVRSETVIHIRPALRRFGFYLVEGTARQSDFARPPRCREAGPPDTPSVKGAPMPTAADRTSQLQAEMTTTMQQYWDATAERYASYEFFNSNAAQRDAWASILARLFPPAESLTILDVGCGSGFVALTLAELGHRVIGLDLSPEMLRVCRADADARGLTNVTLVAGSAEHPPAEIGPVDAVVSRHVLWTLPWPEQAVTAWVGLTQPGGRVVGIDSLWSSELLAATDGEDYPPEVTRFLPLLHARDLQPARNLWRRAGLENVMVERLAWLDAVLRTESPSDAAMMYRDLGFYLVEGTRPGATPAR